MIHYVKCPRCDLNYIDEDKQEYCDVCLAELKGKKLQFADLDVYDDVDAELDEEEATELCPVCGINRMRAGEKMCDQCKGNADEYEEEEEIDPETDEEWKNYLDEDTEEDLTVDDEELAQELEADEDIGEDEDEVYDGEDDDPLDDYDDFDDDDLDGDDEDDDDDDDDDDEF